MEIYNRGISWDNISNKNKFHDDVDDVKTISNDLGEEEEKKGYKSYGGKYTIEGEAILNGTLNDEQIVNAETLSLIGNDFDDNSLEYITSKILPNTFALKFIDIISTQFSPSGLKRFLISLYHSPCKILESLCISDVRLHSEESALIRKILIKYNSTIRKIYLQRCHMDDVTAQSIAEGISTVKTTTIITTTKIENNFLQELRLADNDVVPAFALPLDTPLYFPSSLTILDISGNRIQPAHHKGLKTALQFCANTLQELYLARCSITEEGLSTILHAGLYASKELRVLNISSGRLLRGAGRLICSILTECPNLERLYMEDNLIEADGAARIAIGISCSKKLRVLGMGKCHLEGNGARIITDAVKNCLSLRELDLSNNNLQDADIQYICSFNDGSSLQLEFLDLSNNPLTKRSWLTLDNLLQMQRGSTCTILVRDTGIEVESSYMQFIRSPILF